MDIRNWPLERVMQLPDCLFGRKWIVAESLSVAGGAEGFVISADALPDRCVVWTMFVSAYRDGTAPAVAEFRLGQQIPADLTAFRLLDPIIGPAGFTGIVRSALQCSSYGLLAAIDIRLPILSSGRKLVLRLEAIGAVALVIQAGIVISSIPNEVPECKSLDIRS